MIKKLVILAIGGVSLAVLGTAAARYQKQTPSRAIAALSSDFSFSISKEPVIKPRKIKEELSINCDSALEEARTLAESSQVVMLKFSKCKSQVFTVKNITNGYQAHLFKEKSARLSTDYIQLENGENIIEFEISLNGGQKINKKIKINRIAAF